MLPKTAFSLLSLCALATSSLAAPLSPPSASLDKRGGGFDSFGGGNNRNKLNVDQEDKAAAEKAKATKFNAQDEWKKKEAALDFALDEDVAVFREDLHIEYVKVDADAKAKAAAINKNNNSKVNFKNENEAAAARKKKLNLNKSNSRGRNEFYKRQFEGGDLVDEGGLDDFSGNDLEGGGEDFDLLKRGFDGESFGRDGGEGDFGGFKGRGDGFTNFGKGGDRFNSHNKFDGDSFKDSFFPGKSHFEKGHRGGYGFKGRGGYDH